MDLFHRIDEAQAIVSKGGVFKQVEVYHRDGKVYVATAGGYARVTTKFGSTWGTTIPALKVHDMSHDVPGLFHVTGEPRYTK